MLHARWQIQPENLDGSPTVCGRADNMRTAPLKIALPKIIARMEQSDNGAGFWINSGKVCSFVNVAEVVNVTRAKPTAIDPLLAFR
jgi:hypothetical protein